MLSRLLLATAAFVATAHPHGPPPFSVGSQGCANLVTEYGHFCKSSVATAAYTKYLVCSSEGDEGVECPIGVPPYQKVMAVTLDKAHTGSVCQDGESYGWQGQSIWVKGGCTATFAAQLALDDEQCAAARNKLEQQSCEAALLELTTCHAEMEAFCGNVCRNGACGQPMGTAKPWQGHGPHHLEDHPRVDGMVFHGHHGMEEKVAMGEHGMHQHGGDDHMGHWAQPLLSPVAFKLGQCLQEHMPALSAECRQTALVQTLTAPPPPRPDVDFGVNSDFIGVIAVPTAAACLPVMAICGFVYFFMRRRQLNGRRLAGVEKTGSWSTGLFTCHCKSLLPSCLFPSFQSALNQAEVHDRSSTVADVAMNMATHSLISNTYYTRQAIRAKYDMPEEPMADCLASICCLPCAIAQNTRELEARHGADDEPSYMGPVVGKVVAVKEASDMMMV